MKLGLKENVRFFLLGFLILKPRYLKQLLLRQLFWVEYAGWLFLFELANIVHDLNKINNSW